ncbi:MAG TPA: lipoyl(octanoyl) transferase LipB [Phycisphaerales bacterium]|nr:lipoyl(octanoyl) transferase LipB [Phycisphaerales bacterium]
MPQPSRQLDAHASPAFQGPLIVRDLGRMRYAEAFELQKSLQQDVIGWRESASEGADGSGAPQPVGYLLLVEHDPPVITVSRRKTARQHLIATDAVLRAVGVEVAETDRGGDITYHGPGQLVVYPILDLNRLGLRLHGYMRFLEQVVIDTLARFNITGHRDECATGVWVAQAQPIAHEAPCACAGAPSAKICAMGVRVSRWVSMHGLALNVNTNLDHFNLIVPCGLAGRSVTSLARELNDRVPSMREVKNELVKSFTLAIASNMG